MTHLPHWGAKWSRPMSTTVKEKWLRCFSLFLFYKGFNAVVMFGLGNYFVMPKMGVCFTLLCEHKSLKWAVSMETKFKMMTSRVW